MMLENQRTAIERLVRAGKDLPADLGAAMFAALVESQSAHLAVMRQLLEQEGVSEKLLHEREDTLNLKTQMEEVIERRVKTRTSDIMESLRNVESARDLAVRSCDRAYKDHEVTENHLISQLKTANSRIQQLRELVEQRLKPSILTRLRWKNKAQRVISGLLIPE